MLLELGKRHTPKHVPELQPERLGWDELRPGFKEPSQQPLNDVPIPVLVALTGGSIAAVIYVVNQIPFIINAH